MVSFSPEGHPNHEEKSMKNGEHLPFKPGSTPMQPGEMPLPRSIEQSVESVHASESIKKIKKLLRKNPPLSKEQIEQRDKRQGEHS